MSALPGLYYRDDTNRYVRVPGSVRRRVGSTVSLKQRSGTVSQVLLVAAMSNTSRFAMAIWVEDVGSQ